MTKTELETQVRQLRSQLMRACELMDSAHGTVHELTRQRDALACAIARHRKTIQLPVSADAKLYRVLGDLGLEAGGKPWPT